MTDPDKGSPSHSGRRKRRMSWIWMIPILAALGAFSLVVRAWMEAGPVITITFATAEGLEAGKTQIRFKDVTVGTVRSIRLAEDRSKVYVQADLSKDASSFAQAQTSFWVVRPRLGLSGVSGLGTLVSGAYIAVDAPTGKAVDARGAQTAKKTDFVGLETPPEIAYDRAGKRFSLVANSLGSLDIGSPVYYRHITVGEVVGYHLVGVGNQVDIEVFVDAPHDKYVTGDTRFWNASGIDFTVNAQGVSLRTQSLLSVAVGGVAFEEVAGSETTPAASGSRYTLFGDEESAKAKPNGDPFPIRIRFDQSIRGLSVDAPIDFNGITLGKVESITMDLDPSTNHFFAVVLATIYPERLGAVYEKIRVYAGEDPLHPSGLLLKSLIGRGLRAQLRTANMLTGQLYIALDVFRDAPAVEFTMANPATIPSVPGNLELLQEQLMGIVKTIENIPFDKIGSDLRTALTSASRLMTRLDKQVTPEVQNMLRQTSKSLEMINSLLAPDAPLPANTDRAIQELSRAARSLRGLSDYLQNHPESLIQGRAKDPDQGSGAARK
jgi:paraquat-inducible protein B